MVNGIIFDRVLSVGINYVGTEAELNGCINDVINLKNQTKSKSHVILNELARHPHLTPTRANIIRSIKQFTKGVKPGMNLLFQYSGHGSYTRDTSGDESDKRDETICPLDYATAGDIRDDELKKLLADPLPNGCTLWCFFDACHSGTIMDLQHNYQLTRVPRTRRLRYKIKHSKKIQATKAQIICFSGCQDKQESADAHIKGRYQGAMTWGILASISNLRRRRKPLTYRNIMRELLRLMKKSGFEQVPQISSGKVLNLDTLFTPAGVHKTRCLPRSPKLFSFLGSN